MRSLKIVLIGPAHPLRGGIAAFNERLALELISSGHHVEIESYSLQYPGFLFPGKTQYTTDPPAPELNINTSINSINPLNWYKVGKRIKAKQPDLVISSFWMPFMAPALGTIQRIIKKNGHTRILGLVHNIIPHESRPGDRSLASYFTKYTDQFVVLSDSVAEDIKSFTPQKRVQCLPHPIYDNYGEIVERQKALSYLELSDESKYVLFFGLIRDYKGLDLLIEAMSNPEVRALGIKALVAGEFYGSQQKYTEQIKDLGIEESIIIIPEYIPNDEIKYYFGASNVLIQPYKSGTQSGISQLAYHFELPMIVTNVGGLPEVIQHGASGMISEVNAIDLARCIVAFYQEEKGEIFKEGIRKAKKDFSWDVFVHKLISNYID